MELYPLMQNLFGKDKNTTYLTCNLILNITL